MAIDSDLIRGHVDTIILKTLATGDKYGYEIINEVEAKSNGTYTLKQPTLYSCLKRLESQGFISAYWVNSDIGGKRHYYKLTDLGREEFNNNMNQWLSSRSIIDNLISNDIPAYDNKNYDLEDPNLKQTKPKLENATENKQNEEQQPVSEEIKSFDVPAEEQNPYMQDTENQNEEFGSERKSDIDLSVVEDYYKTDENQINLFNSNKTEAVSECENKDVTSPLNSQENEVNLQQNTAQQSTMQTEIASVSADAINRDGTKMSTKFSIKDYKKNPSSFFNNVKDLVVEDQNKTQNTTTDDFEFSSFSNILQESNYTDTSFNEENHDQETQENYLGQNYTNFNSEEEYEQENEYNSYNQDDESTNSYPESISNEQEDDESYIADEQTFKDDDESDYSHLNFGYSDDENKVESFNAFSASTFDDAEDETEESDIQNLSYWNKGFSIKNNDTSSFKYDYDTEPEFSDRKDIIRKEEYESPAIKNNETDLVEYAEQNDELTNNYYQPYTSNAETTNLFTDNKRSFVPQYTDNDSKQLLNTLSSYGSTTFTPQSTGISEEVSSFEDLKENLRAEGIKVTEYKRRQKEPTNVKNYVLCNKIKCFTSWISYAVVLLFLTIGYLIANSYNYVDFTMLSTNSTGAFYFWLFAGLMLIVPAVYTVLFCLNKTKKVKAKYPSRIAIIFSLLFFIQCLVIVYAINIPFGLYSFVQKDYNHYLWLLPAICSCYIPIHTLIYNLLYRTKKFHIY